MTTKNQVIFENLLHGFNVPLSVLKEWSEQWSSSDTYGCDSNCRRKDPVPLWKNIRELSASDLLSEYEQSVCVDDELKWMQKSCSRLVKNCDIFIDAIIKETPNGPYILFGRDCWPLSLRMAMRNIPHYYVEGASRGIVGQKGFKQIMSGLPCPVGCVLIDTGYRGSIPEAYLKAHGVNEDKFSDYKIRLMSTENDCRKTNYSPIGYEHSSYVSEKRQAFCESMEDLSKFYGRSVHTDSRGYPMFRICRTAYKAYGYYLMILNTPVNAGVKDVAA